MRDGRSPEDRDRTATKQLVALGVLVLVGLVNAGYPMLRFSMQSANFAFMSLLLASPVLAPFLVLSLDAEPLAKNTAALALMPLVLMSLILASINGSDYLEARARGWDTSFEPVASLKLSDATVTAYQTDGGATTDYGIVVRHERILLPGLLLVRNVFAHDHATGASLRALGPHRVEITVPGITSAVDLDPHVYF